MAKIPDSVFNRALTMVTPEEPRNTTNCRSSDMAQGMMEGESRAISFAPRKPLIRKKQMIRRTAGQVRIELHNARWEWLPAGLAQGGSA
jgi:hypothetical protein